MRNVLQSVGKCAWIMHNQHTLIIGMCVLIAIVVLGSRSEAPYHWSSRPTGK